MSHNGDGIRSPATGSVGPAVNGDECGACALPPSRREFIRHATLAVAGALAAVGVSRRAAAEVPVTVVRAISSHGATHLFPIPAADGVQIDRATEIILVRWQKSVYAFNLSCPHQNTAVRWNEDEHHFKCPRHNSRYEPDGTFIDGRATRGLDRFNVTLAGSNVVVDVDTMHKQDVDPAGWTAAFVRIP
jgi:Rieske Fe-S protein